MSLLVPSVHQQQMNVDTFDPFTHRSKHIISMDHILVIFYFNIHLGTKNFLYFKFTQS